jgi:hypothetical protein
MTRAPRDFAGNRSALLSDFFDAMAASLSQGDAGAQAATALLCSSIQASLCQRAVFDVGGLMRVSHQTMSDVLSGVGDNLEHWIDSIEDVLDFKFAVPKPIGPPEFDSESIASAHAAAAKSAASHTRLSVYANAADPGVGAQCLADGTIMTHTISYAMFKELTTANPMLATLTEKEVAHICDTIFEYTFSKLGRVTADIVWRRHIGRQLRVLFPNLPDRGKVKGDSRRFEQMLLYRFNNSRKAQAPGVLYKAGLVLDRCNLCPSALEMVDSKNFPLSVTNDGTIETKLDNKEEEQAQGIEAIRPIPPIPPIRPMPDGVLPADVPPASVPPAGGSPTSVSPISVAPASVPPVGVPSSAVVGRIAVALAPVTVSATTNVWGKRPAEDRTAAQKHTAKKHTAKKPTTIVEKTTAKTTTAKKPTIVEKTTAKKTTAKTAKKPVRERALGVQELVCVCVCWWFTPLSSHTLHTPCLQTGVTGQLGDGQLGGGGGGRQRGRGREGGGSRGGDQQQRGRRQ